MSLAQKTTEMTKRPIGERFGRLVIIGPGVRSVNGRFRWKCLCDCGELINVRLNNLTSGRTKSCGCLSRELSSKRLKKLNGEGKLKPVLILFSFLFMVSVGMAQGRLIIPELPPNWNGAGVYLKYENVDVEINQGVADITLEQVFHNPSPRQLEGEYIFPIPRDAEIHDFFLYINGQKVKGEILDSQQAAQVYERIVRSMKDPALMEFVNYRLFRARIFPILPKSDRKIEIRFAQVLEAEGNVFRFVLPVHQSGQAAIEKFDLKMDLDAGSEISTVYSPSHDIKIDRKGSDEAHISLSANNLAGEKDLIVYYSLANDAISSSMISFRPRTDQDGYFMMMLAPGFTGQLKKKISKDVIFVIDVSGSMQGEKIVQARDALKFCLGQLDPDDRFEIISFNSSVNSFKGKLVSAKDDDIHNARYFAQQLSATGGTNINEALKRALSTKKEKDSRPSSIVFLTDGLPTEGETNIKSILQNVENYKQMDFRVFSFGVGYDVNTYLLDKISEDSHGSANYVRPGENIEKEVSGFFAKISSPVLTSLNLDYGNLEIYDVYPVNLPDIYQKQHITIFGRYRGSGSDEVILSGLQDHARRRFEYDVVLPGRESENEFVAKLWANRKVAHLLTQIRFNGENPELVKSVKDLGLEYGIVTPYTSYLVREQREEMVALERRTAVSGAPVSANRQMQAARGAKKRSENDDMEAEELMDALSQSFQPAASSAGKGAVQSSKALQKVARQEKSQDMLMTVKKIGTKTYNLKNGVWTERGIDVNRKPDAEIVFLSDEYFALIERYLELNRILSLGEEILFSWSGKIYRIHLDS